MKKLLKFHKLNSDMQYYEHILFLYRCGFFIQANERFKDMPKKYQKVFVDLLSEKSNWGYCDLIIKTNAFSHFLTIL